MPDYAPEEGYIQNGEVRLHYVAAGPVDGEPVLLIHGFPQFSYEWRYHLPRLAEEGYRVVAPDLRGYNLSDRPTGLEAYRMQNLVSDIGAFYRAFGWTSANLVAHDWGGAVSWLFAIFYPQQVRRLVAIDIPHPTAFRTALKTMEQMQRSWYIWFLQPEGIPERIFGDRVEEFLDFMMFQTARPGTFSPEDRRRYIEVFSQPGQLEAAFNYYRASTSPSNVYAETESAFPPLTMPVMLIYGEQDFAFVPLAWAETARHCVGPYRAVGLKGVGHWAVEEAPEDTLGLIQEHLASQS